MNTEKTNGKKDKAAGTDFGCNPKDFKGMFEMMGKCCNGQDGFPDCTAMMKSMMQNCCEPKTENTKFEKQKK
jgi:hypothetical protein